jgi:hypothetical protein
VSSAKHTEAIGVVTKIETTYNTDASPATTDAVRIIKPRPELTARWGYDGDRGLQGGGFGRIQRAGPTGRSVSGTIRMEGKGRGSAYSSSSVEVPDVHRWLRASGFTAGADTTPSAEFWTFSMGSGTAAPASVTSWFYGRGEVWKVAGIYASLKITSSNAGIPVWEFPFAGTMAADPTDVTLPGLTYTSPTVVPPVATGVQFTFANLTSGIIRDWEFDLGRVFDTPRINQNTAAGHAGFQPGPRNPKVTFSIEATSLQGSPYTASSALDPYNLWKTATTGAFSIQIGATQYNKWRLSFGQAQFTNVELVDDGSVALWKCTVEPYVTGDQGTDDLNLLFN